ATPAQVLTRGSTERPLAQIPFFCLSCLPIAITPRMWSYPLPKSGMGCSMPIGFKKRRYENAPNAQSEVAFQAWSRPDTWRRMHNELDDRDELLVAWLSVAGA